MNPQCTTPSTPPSYATVGETGNGKIGGISSASSNLSGVDYYPELANCTPSAASSCYAHQDVAMNQLRMIKAAFACDYVRVATFMYSAGTNWVVFLPHSAARRSARQPWATTENPHRIIRRAASTTHRPTVG